VSLYQIIFIIGAGFQTGVYKSSQSSTERFVGVEDFQPLQKVGDFRLPMLVISPIVKVGKGLGGSMSSMGSKGSIS
jgi:hypothetical protein